MLFLHVESLRYPLSAEQVYVENRGEITIPTPETVLDGYAQVVETVPPEYDTNTHKLVEKFPEKTNSGEWTQIWSVEPLSNDELSNKLRFEKESLVEAATQTRKSKEAGGIILPDGTHISTTTEDQNRITSIIANAHLAGVNSVNFKAVNGWVELTIEQIQQIAAAVALHVQECFTAERTHHEAISLIDNLSDIRNYDINQGWPTYE